MLSEEQQREMGEAAGRAAAQEALGRASSMAREGFASAKSYVTNSPTSLRVMCFCLGGATFVIYVLGLFNIFGVLYPTEYTLNIFVMLFGLLTMILEANPAWMNSTRALKLLYHHAFFLSNPLGRGFFYIFLGCVIFGQSNCSHKFNFFNFCLGIAYFVFGVLCSIVGCRSGSGSYPEAAEHLPSSAV
mmetsp:Transcript_35326/g.77374  ORF Transcript_35326/g.77374 Transcript_35326/m.77374 type:complete len:188 (+) Transcript_35326:58-621(+)